MSRCLLVTAMAAGLLAGCASQPGTRVPDGPWAQEFQQAYDAADDPFIKEVVRDGVVSDEEYSEVVARYRDCMADSGITLKENPPSQGGFSYTFPSSVSSDDAHAVDSRCSEQAGENVIGALYHLAQRNPDHLDENQIVYECLLGAGIIDSSYTLDEFAADYVTQSFPFAADRASMDALAACDADPLGLIQ